MTSRIAALSPGRKGGPRRDPKRAAIRSDHFDQVVAPEDAARLPGAPERLAEGGHRGEADRRVLGERLGDEGVEVGRNDQIAPNRAQRRERLARVPLGEERIGPGEGHAPGEHLEEDDAERIHVGAWVAADAGGLFGRHVLGRARDDRARRRVARPGLARDLREAEVDQLDDLAPVGSVHQEEVLRLDVAVDHARPVRGGQPVRGRVGDPRGAARRQRPRVRKRIGEIEPDEELHREERRLGIVDVHLIDAEHVGVVDEGGGARLAREASERRALSVLGAEHLERDPLPARVADAFGEVDMTGPAASEVLDDPEAPAEELADEAAGLRAGRHSSIFRVSPRHFKDRRGGERRSEPICRGALQRAASASSPTGCPLGGQVGAGTRSRGRRARSSGSRPRARWSRRARRRRAWRGARRLRRPPAARARTRRLTAEEPREQRLSRRRAREVGAAHDLGDPHREIVDDDGELVGEHAVAALQHEIAGHRRHVLDDGAEHRVVESARCPRPRGPRGASPAAAADRARASRSAGTCRDSEALRRLRAARSRRARSRRASSRRVGEAGARELVDRGGVELAPRRLS